MHLILASASPRRRELLTAAGYMFDVVPPSDAAESGLCSNCGPAELVADLASAKAADVVRQLTEVGRGKGESSGQWAVGSRQEEEDREQGTGKREEKAATCNPQSPIRNPQSTIILAADTVAECGGHILGKPRHEEHARQMLEMLSGQEHRVYTGVCIWPLGKKTGSRGQETGDREQAEKDWDDVAATEIPNPQSPGPITRVAVTTLRMDLLTDARLDDYLASGGWKNKAGAFGYQDRLGWVHVTSGSESNVVGLPMELVRQMLREVEYDDQSSG